jgi:hypothetical protein
MKVLRVRGTEGSSPKGVAVPESKRGAVEPASSSLTYCSRGCCMKTSTDPSVSSSGVGVLESSSLVMKRAGMVRGRFLS